MAWQFEFNQPKARAFAQCRTVLEDNGYDIEVYAPESYFIVTTERSDHHLLQKFDYALVLVFNDRLDIYITASKYVYKRGSQLALLGREMLNQEAADRLPYRLQRKIIEPLQLSLQEYQILPVQ